jgi:beta-lactamase class A
MKRYFATRTAGIIGLVPMLAFVSFGQAFTDKPKESPARAQIEQLIRQTNADVSVAFRALDGSQELFIHQDEGFPATPSTIQVPVMMELYSEAAAGELKLSDTLVVQNRFPGASPGAFYGLDPVSDPDKELYKEIGRRMTLGDLCEHMMARNSTLAADLLIERLGVRRIQLRIQNLHAQGMLLNHPIEPRAESDPNGENKATAQGIFEMLWRLAKGQEAGDAASTEMIGRMARGAESQSPTAGMPPDPRAALSHELSDTYEDAMIVFGPHPFVVVIVVRGVPDAEARAELAAQIEHALAAQLGPSI